MAASQTAGSTTQTSQTPFLRGMASEELLTSNLKVKAVQKLSAHVLFQGFLCVCTHDLLHLPPPRSHFSLSLKTHSSFGLIFYVSDEQEDNFMALFLAHGKLVYTFNVADQRVKIKSEERYNDGGWHNVSSLSLYVCMGGCMFSYVPTISTVTTSSLLRLKVVFIRHGSMGRLIIDGLTVLEDRAPGSNVSWHVSSPIYVGGVPPGRAQKNIQVWVKVYVQEI